MKTLLWTPAHLSERGGGAGLLNSVRTLQYLEKSLDCCSRSSTTTPQFIFFGTRAAIPVLLTLSNAHWKHECCGRTPSLTKTNISDSYVLSVITKVSIFIQIFGLYSGPVKQIVLLCGGGGRRILHHLFGIKRKLPSCSLRSRFSWHVLSGSRDPVCLSLCSAARLAVCSVFVSYIKKKMVSSIISHKCDSIIAIYFYDAVIYHIIV